MSSRTHPLYIEEASRIPVMRNPENPAQYEFLTAKEPFVLFSGGVGAGKTAAFCWRAIALSVTTPYFGDMSGNVGLLGRYSLTSFYKTTYPELKKWLPASWIRKWYAKDGIIELRNESIIHFTHFDDMEHLHSYNIGWAGIDQLEQVPEEVFTGIALERIRMKYFNRYMYVGRNGQKIPLNPPVALPVHTVFATCNPKRGWVYDVFVRNAEYRKSPDPDIQAKFNPSFRLISVSTGANAMFLPEQYIDNQKANMSEREYRRRVLGTWDAFEGQVYEDFSDDFVLKKRLIPRPEWKLYIGIDHGGTGTAPKSNANNITAVVFVAIEERPGDWPKIHVFDELYLPSSTIEETVEAIDHRLRAIMTAQRIHYPEECKEVVAEHPKITAWRCDPSMNRRSGDTVETIMEAYMRHASDRGFTMPLAPGDNELESGIHKIAWMFRRKLVDICPHCANFISEHHNYEFGENEKPKRGQADHECDAFRYTCSAIPLWWKNFQIKPKETVVDMHLRKLREQQNGGTRLDRNYSGYSGTYGIR